MISRTIKNSIIRAMSLKPVVLISGARQVGKTVICQEIKQEFNFNYVSLDNVREREVALRDPELFLELHKAPLIIGEVQFAPKLFDVIEGIVNKRKFDGFDNKGMYILTSSQSFKLVKGVTQSMAGRVALIDMLPLSLKEIQNVKEDKFKIDPLVNNEILKSSKLNNDDIFNFIVKGFYPELYDENSSINSDEFYSYYVRTYIERDVSEIIQLKDKLKFQRFMEILASLTGEEFVANSIAKDLGVSLQTINSWISVLEATNIVYFLQPYFEYSVLKRAVKRNKLYFYDTGLAAYLARLNNVDVLRNSYFCGRFVETFIINEIIKSFKNNNKNVRFYYYRDFDQNEIDLLYIEDGIMHFIECKSGISYSKADIRAFKKIKKETKMAVGLSALICFTDSIYTLDEGVYCLPIRSI